MFERFTEQSRAVIVLAQQEARTLKHNHIGSEHILLGLLAEKKGLAARVLSDGLEITLESARAQVVQIVGTGEEVRSEQIPLMPQAKNLLTHSLREALSLGHNYLGTEHLLLGLLHDDNVATRVLADLDADAEKVRNEVMQVLREGPRQRYGGALGTLDDDLGLHTAGGWLQGEPRASTRKLAQREPNRVHPGSRVRQGLTLAARRARAANRTEIEPYDLLYALVADKSSHSCSPSLALTDKPCVRRFRARSRASKLRRPTSRSDRPLAFPPVSRYLATASNEFEAASSVSVCRKLASSHSFKATERGATFPMGLRGTSTSRTMIWTALVRR